jgi:hypothetical protein
MKMWPKSPTNVVYVDILYGFEKYYALRTHTATHNERYRQQQVDSNERYTQVTYSVYESMCILKQILNRQYTRGV